MKTTLYLLIFPLIFSSCKQSNCEISSISNIEWDHLNASVSYKICPTGHQKLESFDSVRIEYLGILKPDEEILIQRPVDSMAFSNLTNIAFGTFKYSGINFDSAVVSILKLMKKNSIAILQYNLSDIPVSKQVRKMIVWFRDPTDSIESTSFITSSLLKDQYDSMVYISKLAATKMYLGENDDTTWMNVLDKNPLPTSVEIYLKPEYFSKLFLEVLKDKLLKSQMVTDVAYPQQDLNILSMVSESLKSKFLIRLKT